MICLIHYSAILNTVKEITAPRRPLNPARKARRKPKPLNVHVTSAKILIRVVRAFNIPTRTTGQTAGWVYNMWVLRDVTCDHQVTYHVIIWWLNTDLQRLWIQRTHVGHKPSILDFIHYHYSLSMNHWLDQKVGHLYSRSRQSMLTMYFWSSCYKYNKCLHSPGY